MGRWQPGQSGNPRGRPRVVAELRDLARERTEDAIGVLASIMNDPRQPPGARVAAARLILERGWGRPPQAEDFVHDPHEDDLDRALAEIVNVRAQHDLS